MPESKKKKKSKNQENSSVASGSSASLQTEDDLSSKLSVVNAQTDKFFHKIKKPKKPYKRAHFVAVSGRDNLEAALLNSKDKDNPDLNFVMKLGMQFWLATLTLCALRWDACWLNMHTIEVWTIIAERKLQRGHLDTFFHEGLYGEQYHLRRAKELYSNLITGVLEEKDGYGLKKDKLMEARKEYCYVQGLNDGKELGEEARAVANILVDVGDIGMEVFSLLSGSVKEAIDHDEAANSFHNCQRRNSYAWGTNQRRFCSSLPHLNQLEAQAASEDREYEHDYRMIHLQAIQDKSIGEDVSYEDWLGNFETGSE